MDAANCAAVLLSVPISYHFHGCTALLVALVVVSGAILNTHLYLYLSRQQTLNILPKELFHQTTHVVVVNCSDIS